MVLGAEMTAVVLDDAPLWKEDKERERKGRERQAGHMQDFESLLVLADTENLKNTWSSNAPANQAR